MTEPRNDTYPDLDDAFDVLSHGSRRLVLTRLRHQRGLDVTTLLEGATDENGMAPDAPASLYHRHLPKLADAGFIEWDRDAGRVERGPRYDDLSPILSLLADDEEAVPAECH